MGELANIKQIIQHLKPELAQRFHVQSIGLFGSIVRDDFSATSDIDIIVDFDQPVGKDLSFDEFIKDSKTVDAVIRNFRLLK
jgi:predicted nucleotidyltransferase